MYQIYVDNELFCDSRVDDLAVLNPRIDLEVNKAGSFEFMIPPEHPYYETITKRLSLIKVIRDDVELFEGICTSVTDDFYKQRLVNCEGSLSFFNDTIQRPVKYTNKTVRGLLESYIAIHNSLCEERKHFTVGIVTVTDSNNSISCYTNYETTMQSIKEDLVDDLGGYLRVRNTDGVRYIDYLADSPNTASQTIKLGQNLIDFESTLDTTQIATVIIPLGATLEQSSIAGLDERLTIKSVNNNLDYLVNEEAVEAVGWIEKVVTWDNVTTAAVLKSKGQKYLTDTQFENLVIEANAIDLHFEDPEIEQFKILDKIRVVSAPHGLNKYFVLTKQTINLNKPESDKITLGSADKITLTAQNRSDNTEILKRVEDISVSSILDSAKNNATQQIVNAGNGYITMRYNDDMQPYELLIMDTDNIETATKVWRWNEAGLAYSDQGYYASQYKTAITADGQIVADFITTGTLTANRIKGGTLKLGGADNVNGAQRIYDANGSKVVDLNNNGIIIYDDDSDLTDQRLRINATHNGSKYETSLAFNGLRMAKYNSSTKNYVDYGFCGMGQALWWKDPNISGRQIGMDGRQFYMNNDGLTFYITVQINGNQEWPYIMAKGGLMDIGVVNAYDLIATRTKPKLVTTENYGRRLLYAYETPSPLFGDLGEGITDDEGTCYITIEDIFSETIDTEVQYQVFLQAYGVGSVYVAERTPTHFVVKGTPGLAFGWEMKAAQKGYDSMRLEVYEEKQIDEEHQIIYDND